MLTAVQFVLPKIIVKFGANVPIQGENGTSLFHCSGINERQQVHSIPAKHCVLSGAQAHEREEPCRELLSPNVRFVLTLAVAMILVLLIVILVIYRRNRT